MSFLNSKDVEALRDHYLAMIERAQQGLRILNRGRSSSPEASASPSRAEEIPDGAWKMHPASEKQIATLEKFKVQFNPATLTKGEAADIIKDLFARRSQ